MSLLEVEGLVIRFGGHTAVDNVDLKVEAGTITGLIGPNGAGKTTTFNAVNGLLPPTEGRVVLDGKDITKVPTHKRAQLGMARTFQRLELFTSLSVRDNIRVAGEIRNRWSKQKVKPADETERIIDLLGLRELADREVAEIPTGMARRVELGRALMTNPKILLLDEPASGQDEQETVEFGALLRRLVDDGTTILIVEHDMALVMAICDLIYVLDFGQIIAVGKPAEIQKDTRVLEAYLGSEETL